MERILRKAPRGVDLVRPTQHTLVLTLTAEPTPFNRTVCVFLIIR